MTSALPQGCNSCDEVSLCEMRLNESEMVAAMAQAGAPDWEGPLRHRAGAAAAEYKWRWFRLRANFLFAWKTNDAKRPPSVTSPPAFALLLERSHVQQEGFSAESEHAFAIIYDDDKEDAADAGGGRRRHHMFLAESARHVRQWIEALRKAKYDSLRTSLISLQIRILNRTGRDPLRGTGFENNPVYYPNMRASRKKLADEAPKPKPRTKSKPKSTFKSHLVERWEDGHYSKESEQDVGQTSDPGDGKKASFKSHLEGNLIDF